MQIQTPKKQPLIITMTGHTNIEKAVQLDLVEPNGRKYNTRAFGTVYKMIDEGLKGVLEEYEVTIVSGMARGVDEVLALYAMTKGLPLILSIPNSVNWHMNRGLSRDMRAQAVYYQKILDYENLVAIHEIKKTYDNGSDNHYHFANFARNQHMTDISDRVYSFKSYVSSGTDDCIKRAREKGNYVGNLFQKKDDFEDFL